MLMVILQKMHAIKKESKAIFTKMKKKINFVSWVKENRKSLGFSTVLLSLRRATLRKTWWTCRLVGRIMSAEESLSTWFFVTPCILGAALGWSYDDQRMAERVSVVKKSRLCFSSFLASLSPKALFYMRRVSGFSLLYTKLWKKKTRSQLLFCFLKNSNRRQKVFHSYIFLGL